nr:serine/threonine-protein kinase PLK4-like [Nerophis lumbriciformis]
MSVQIGDTINDFDVLNLLGKGSYGSVYRAKSKKTGLEVAIKMIEMKFLQKAKMRQRVASEVDIHCRLKHPSILEMYSYFEDDNYVYMVLELCHHGAMHVYMKERKMPFSEEEARDFMRQIVKGMIYLHTHAIVHRDLSLSNLLLTNNMKVKIADFGLATRLEHPDEKHFTMCGTPNYISPEVVNRGAHGLASDLWSLGCMFYTFLTGHPPFDTDTAKDTLFRVVNGQYKMPGYVSPQAQDLIQQLLQKDPARRLSLSEVLDHPFMTWSKELGRGDSSSADSGINTFSTGCAFSSSGRNSRPQRRTGRVVGPILPDHAAAVPGLTHFEDGEHSRERRLQPPHPLHRFRDEGAGTGGALYEGGTEQPHPGFLRRAHSSDRCGSSGPIRGLSKQDRWHSEESPTGYGRPLFPSASAPHPFSEHGRIPSPPVKQPANSAYLLSTQTTHPPNLPYRNTEEVNDWHNNEGSGRRPVDRSAHCSGDAGHGSWTETPAGRVPDPHGSLRGFLAAGPDVFQGEKVPGAHLRPLHGYPWSQPPAVKDVKEKKTLRELVPPLCTTRLKPIRQKTKNAVVSILDTGEVCMEFLKCQNGQERVTEVLRISPDGSVVTIEQPGRGKSFAVLDRPTSPTENTLICSYGDLPEKYWKKYQYAAKFVQLVKSKTPKVSIYTSYGKVMLMENSPDADLEVCFYDGTKSHKTSELLRVVEKNGRSHTVKDEAGLIGLSAECSVYARLSNEGHVSCLMLEATIKQVEGLRNTGNEKVTLFPITCGRRPAPRSSPQLSLLPSHPCRVSPPRPPHITPSMIYDETSGYTSAILSKCSSACQDVLRNAGKEIFIEGVAYASSMPAGGGFSLAFLDGSRLQLTDGLIVYTSPEGSVTRYEQTEKFPAHILEKMRTLSAFLAQSGNTSDRHPQAH